MRLLADYLISNFISYSTVSSWKIWKPPLCNRLIKKLFVLQCSTFISSIILLNKMSFMTCNITYIFLVSGRPILYPLPATSRYTEAWDWFKNTQTTDFFCFRLSAYTFEGIIFLRLFIIWKSRANDLWTSKNPTQKWKN